MYPLRPRPAIFCLLLWSAHAATWPVQAAESFLEWSVGKNLTGANAGALAAPAGDGVPNAVKFALGLEPGLPAAPGQLPVVGRDAGGRGTLTFFARNDIAATVQAEASTDLTTWNPAAVEEIARTPGSGGDLVTVRETLPGSPGRSFLRLRVSLPGPPAPYANDPLAPTPLLFAAGNNTVAGQVAAPRNTRDFFRFTVPEGTRLTGIYLEKWTAEADNLGYMHIDSGTATVVPSAATIAEFLGGIHVSRGLFGPADNLLSALAAAPQGGTGFSTPLPAGDYVFNVQQTGPQESAYTLRFVIEYLPERLAVTNAGASSYTIDGVTNPTLELVRGRTYEFAVLAVGHPFWIKTVATTGPGNAYNNGVTNNGTQSGLLTFTVPLDAPSTLYYICQFHFGMRGAINITDP